MPLHRGGALLPCSEPHKSFAPDFIQRVRSLPHEAIWMNMKLFWSGFVLALACDVLSEPTGYRLLNFTDAILDRICFLRSACCPSLLNGEVDLNVNFD